jgi:hypothetical protein
MVEFEIKINPEQRLAYIPKEIYAVLSNHAKAIPNRVAVLIFRDGVSREDVLKSLDIIKQDLLHAQEMEKQSVET